MKVLYITLKPIYPKIDGGCVAMDNFLSCLLEKKIEVKHLFIHTSKHPYEAGNYPNELAEKIQPEGVFIDTEVHAKEAFAHLFKKGAYNVERFYSKEMESLIHRQLEMETYSAVILESLFVTPYVTSIKALFKGKVFVRTHNVEHEIWKYLSQTSKNIARRAYLKKLANDLETYELDVLKEVDGLISISSDDAKKFREMGIDTPSIVIPVTIPIDDFQNDYSANSFYHLGAMNWQPNIEAVDRLIQLLPYIQKEAPLAKLHIAGKGADEGYSTDADKGIFVHGFVHDIRQFSVDHGILVSPILSGSGIRIKLLEAMALGMPCVTTTIGAKGIDYMSSNCLLVADSDEEIVANCLRLYSDVSLRKEIGNNARDYIRKNHNIETVSQQIIEFIRRT